MPSGGMARKPFPRPAPAVELRFGAPTPMLARFGDRHLIAPHSRFLPWSFFPLGVRMKSGATNIERVCLTRVRYAFRFSQPLDVFLPASPYPGCFTGLTPSGLSSSKVFIPAPGKDASRHPCTCLPLARRCSRCSWNTPRSWHEPDFQGFTPVQDLAAPGPVLPSRSARPFLP